ncbi:MAG: glycosyltransferase family 2 protein [Ginsengibacter sp.]
MKFSVIIPTFNRFGFLEKAIKSVNEQTYQNYEIIVVNDNPKDKDKINALAANYNKVTVIHHPFTQGGNAARNSGILNSNGEIIAFLDDDDLWLPEKLKTHLEKHQLQPNVGLVYSECLYVFNNSFLANSVSTSQLPFNITEAMSQGKFCPATSSAVSIKRECIKECGLFDEGLVSFQDWDYWFRIAHVFQFSYIPKILVHYKQHLGDRTSHNESKRRLGLNQICNKWKNELSTQMFIKNFIQTIYYKNSRNALMAGEKLYAFKESFKLLNREVISIRSIKNFIKISLHLIIKRKNYLESE